MDWLFEKNDISQQEEDSKPKTEYTVCRTKECFQVGEYAPSIKQPKKKIIILNIV